jgi:hypothetical protein
MHGRLSLTSQMETREDRILWWIASRRVTVGRGTPFALGKGASEQAVWSRPICPTLCGLVGHRVSHHYQIRINPNTGSAIRVLRSIARLAGRCRGLGG